MSDQESHYQGCLLGLALGDAFNAPLEGGPIERLVWRMIGKTSQGKRRYTDDTQMSLDLARSLIDRGELDLDDVARRFARSYRWSRGYGPAAAKLLKKIRRGQDWRSASTSVYPEGSWGNGGAMRAPVIGLAYASGDVFQVADKARESARITHAHELGMQGAAMIAGATVVALRGGDIEDVWVAAREVAPDGAFTRRIEVASRWLDADGEPRSGREIRAELGSGMTATESCVTALYLASACHGRSFEEMIALAGDCGGDTDTISSMAGAVWGAWRGVEALPGAWIEQLEDAEIIREVASSLALI